MTEEIRTKANQLARQLEDLEDQIQIVEDMHHSDNSIQIRCSQAGEITIAGDDELKDVIIDLILNKLTTQKLLNIHAAYLMLSGLWKEEPEPKEDYCGFEIF